MRLVHVGRSALVPAFAAAIGAFLASLSLAALAAPSEAFVAAGLIFACAATYRTIGFVRTSGGAETHAQEPATVATATGELNIDDRAPDGNEDRESSVRQPLPSSVHADRLWMPELFAEPHSPTAARADSAQVEALLLDLGAALHDLAWTAYAEISPRERRRLGHALRQAVGPVRAVAELAEKASANDAERVQRLLVPLACDPMGSGDSASSHQRALGEFLHREIGRNPEELLTAGTFEATAAEFLADLDLAIGEWTQAAKPRSAVSQHAVRLTPRAISSVFAKLGAKTRTTSGHVAAVIDVSPDHNIRLFYSRGRDQLPPFVAEKFRRTMRLDNAEFERLISCAMTQKEFVHTVRSRLSEQHRGN